MRYLLLALTLNLITGGVALADVFTGKWVNDKGSELVLSVDDTGAVTGTFDSEVGDGGVANPRPINGKAVGDIITFNTFYLFGNGNVIVSWSGQVRDIEGKKTLKTQWLHVTDVPETHEEEWMWYNNRIGSDNFVLQE